MMEREYMQRLMVTVPPNEIDPPRETVAVIEARIARIEKHEQEQRAKRLADIDTARVRSYPQASIDALLARNQTWDRSHNGAIAELRAQLAVARKYEQQKAEAAAAEQRERQQAMETAAKTQAKATWLHEGGGESEFEQLWPQLYSRILANKVTRVLEQGQPASVNVALNEF
jgi:hypothetical protein